MGKGKNTAAPDVLEPAAPAVVAPAAAVPKLKTGRKRVADDEIEKSVSSKKQKAAPHVPKEPAKKAKKQRRPNKAKKQPPPKKAESSTPEEVSSESDEVKTHVTQDQALSPKILFVGNLPFAVDIQDLKNFFCGVVEPVDINLPTHDDGHPKGFGYVTFATTDDAAKAVVLNGQELMGRPVRVDRIPEENASSDATRSLGAHPYFSVYVKGFDKLKRHDDIESSLYKHFSKCGEITRVYVPIDRESGTVKGIAFVDFSNERSFKEALDLSRSSLGGYVLHVEEAKPKAEFGSGSWSGGHGRRSDGGRRGGVPGYQSHQTAGSGIALSSGKKMPFDND